LGNDKLAISIVNIPEEDSVKALSFDEFKKMGWAELSSPLRGGGKFYPLSLLDKSKNGTSIFEEIYTSTDPVSNTQLKNKRVILFNSTDHVHQIIFQTKATDFESMQETINKIQNSIVLT
ncbi:MAG: hypothetical protein ACXVHP_08575, partial [Methanobacterium sp.]